MSKGNPAPKVVPSIQEWHGATAGKNFTLTSHTRFVAPSTFPTGSSVEINTADNRRGEHNLNTTAEQKTQAFFTEMLGITPEIVASGSRDSDIVFVYEPSLQDELGQEGYRISINDSITISAGHRTGLLYGGVTLTQIFYASDDKRTAPMGEARDYPQHTVRAGMIDVGRTYYPLAYLEEVGKYMAWFKLNELHVHLNDYWGNAEFAAMRLESDNYDFAAINGHDGTANPGGEGTYSKADYRRFQLNLLEYGIEVVNELDTPAHSRIFGRLPESQRPPVHPSNINQMDITTPQKRSQVIGFVLGLFCEYISDGTFVSNKIHFGGDEYDLAHIDALATYKMETIKALRGGDARFHPFNLEVRLWSSQATLNANVIEEVIRDPKVRLTMWHPEEVSADGGVGAVYEKGYNVINTSNLLYIVPANYNGYPDRYGGIYWQNAANPSNYSFENIYDTFHAANFHSERRGAKGSWVAPPNHPQTQGVMFCMWHDIVAYNGGLSEFDLFDRFKEGVIITAEKAWYGKKADCDTWESFAERAHKQWNRAGGANPARFVESISGLVASYDFGSGNPLNDLSGNGYNVIATGSKSVPEGLNLPAGIALRLPFKSMSFPYSVSMEAKLANVPPDTALFHGADGTLFANFRGSGNIGFIRGQYGLEYHFAYQSFTHKTGTSSSDPTAIMEQITVPQGLIKADEWFTITLVTQQTYPAHSNPNPQVRTVPSWTDVALYINGIKISPCANNVWINNDKKFVDSGGVGQRTGITYDSASFVLPLEKILPDVDAVIRSLQIFNRPLTPEEIGGMCNDRK